MKHLCAIIRWGLHAISAWWSLAKSSFGFWLGIFFLVVGLSCELLFFVCGELGIAGLHPPVRESGPCLHLSVEVCTAITIRETSLSEISAVFGISERSLQFFNARPFSDKIPAGSIVVLPLQKGWP